jgi:hypothetical protein
MKVIEVQPTPNPNAMKFLLDATVSERPLSFFNAEAGKDHPLASALFAIPGVAGLLLLNDFITVSKTPNAVWKDVTPAVKRLLVMRSEAAGK